MESFDWAQEQFHGAPLPDLRLRRRLVEVAACIRQNPCGTLPRAIGSFAGLKGAYRLLAHRSVKHERILQTHVKRTQESCRQLGEYLLVEDTTTLSFSHRSPMAGMGPLTSKDSQGLLVHTCLAMRIEQWNGVQPEVTLTGLFGQQCWAREIPRGTRTERKKFQRKKGATSPRESDKWAHALRASKGPPPGAQWTLVTDREGDVFGVMAQCKSQGGDWIIRGAQARVTMPDQDNVFEAAAHSPVLSSYTISLRARPGIAAREAHVELRAATRVIRPPAAQHSLYDPITAGLVEVRENNPPAGVEGIHWLLFTTWPCTTADEARRVTETYTCRWLIEEYHKALKTGTSIEDSQLATAHGIEALLAIHAVVAVDLLRLKLLASACPDEPIPEDVIAPECITVLEIKHGKPPEGWTNKTIMKTIARMGGHIGRRNDGPPGWLSIWRGYFKLTLMTEGYLLALGRKTCG